jgi:hypothetical protein
LQVLRAGTTEPTRPFLQTAIISIAVFDTKIGRVLSFALNWQGVCQMPALLAQTPMVVPPSQQNSLAGVPTPSSAVAMDTRSIWQHCAGGGAAW